MRDDKVGRRAWCLGALRFDESTREVAIGDQVKVLEPVTAGLLMLLLRRPNRVVLKEDFFRVVWAGRLVTESALTKSMARLRAALGADGERLIQTVHGTGYRLFGDPRQVGSVGYPSPSSQRKAKAHTPNLEGWQLRHVVALELPGQWFNAERDDGTEGMVCLCTPAVAAALSLEHDYQFEHAGTDKLQMLAPMLRWLPQSQPPVALWAHLPQHLLSHWRDHAPNALAQLSKSARWALAIGIVRAMVAVHAGGRFSASGLRPEMVLMLPDGAVKLWGLQLMAPLSDLTPPEHLRLHAAPSAISDVYSTAYLAWQVLIGDLRTRLVPGWHLLLDCPEASSAIAQATQLDPARRTATAAALLAALETAQRICLAGAEPGLSG